MILIVHQEIPQKSWLSSKKIQDFLDKTLIFPQETFLEMLQIFEYSFILLHQYLRRIRLSFFEISLI